MALAPPAVKPTQVMAFGMTKTVKKTLALNGADLSVEGGLTTLLGPNGAGKTTLLRCLATVWMVDSGSVLVDGLNPSHESDRIEIRRRLGYMAQEPGFAASARVFDVVDYVAVLKRVGHGQLAPDRWRRQHVMELLDQVGLADRAADEMGSLSGGMRRRVGLAQALLGSPSLLLLDEPAAGLDPEERTRLRSILAERRHQATVIQSTHLTDEAAYSDRVLVMSQGHLAFDGTPTRLAEVAKGRTWVQATPPGPNAGHVQVTWRQADGTYRCLGQPTSGAELVEPTIEDGYLLTQRRSQ